MNNALVEEVAASLVREYLSRKGLKKTISIMDQELPRTNSSVNNRNDLRRVLKLESLYKMNKAQEIPLKAMLEIIVKHCLETQNMTNTRTEDCLFQKNTEPKSRSSVMSSVSVCDISDEEKGGSTAVSNQSKTDVYRSSDDIACTSYKFPSYTNSQSNSKISAKCVKKNASSSEGERDSQQRSFSYAKDSDSLKVDVLPTEVNNAFTELQKPRSGRIIRGMMAGPVASSQEESNKKRFLRRSSGSNVALPLKDEELKNNSTSNSVPSSLATIQLSQSKSISSDIEDSSTNELFERELNRMEKKDTHAVKNDINDEEEFCELSRVPVFSSTSRLNVAAHPIDLNLAVDLKNILFGSSFACFNDEWKIQSFPFNDLPDLRYGIVQKKGGPCGVLASVQACVLQKLLFEETSSSSKSHAISNLVYSQIRYKTYTSRSICGSCPAAQELVNLLLTGRAVSNVFNDVIELDSGNGNSTVLNGITGRSDIGLLSLFEHYNLCKELVNLLLTGRAVSNVFNDVIELDSGNGNSTVLNGITGRSDIGLLSLFEHYNLCKVCIHLYIV
ncbi:UNVERIFIED_CONTAM: hypothetical protein FKN15_014651 [Acipenser sinensis]